MKMKLLVLSLKTFSGRNRHERTHHLKIFNVIIEKASMTVLSNHLISSLRDV